MTRPIRRASAAVLMTSCLLCGCVTKVTLPQRQALDSLVGKTRAELLGALGRPSAVTPAMVTYVYRSTTLQADEIGAPDNPPLTLHNRARFVTHMCDTQFLMSGDRVAAWSVRGSDCWQSPYPYLGNLERDALVADERGDAATPFLFNSRTGNSLVLSGDFQSR